MNITREEAELLVIVLEDFIGLNDGVQALLKKLRKYVETTQPSKPTKQPDYDLSEGYPRHRGTYNQPFNSILGD